MKCLGSFRGIAYVWDISDSRLVVLRKHLRWLHVQFLGIAWRLTEQILPRMHFVITHIFCDCVKKTLFCLKSYFMSRAQRSKINLLFCTLKITSATDSECLCQAIGIISHALEHESHFDGALDIIKWRLVEPELATSHPSTQVPVIIVLCYRPIQYLVKAFKLLIFKIYFILLLTLFVF